jgi:hypothetical protein
MLAYLFVVLAVAVRFMPHPWHFTPVAASLLFFGAYGSRRQAWFPVVLLAASDVVLSKFVYGYPLSWDLLVTWAFESVLDCALRPGQLCFLFPAQQFCSMGRIELVPEDAFRAGHVLRNGGTVFPRHIDRRSGIHRGLVCRSSGSEASL